MISRVEFDEAVDLARRLAIGTIPRQAQTQVSLDAQLRVLEQIAVKYGLYDASDFLRRHLK